MLYWQDKGRYQQEYDVLWERLVPPSDEADTLQGELIRSIGRLTGEHYRNGRGNWNRFYRAFTTFLRKYLRDKKVFDADAIRQVEQDIQAIRVYGAGGQSVGKDADGEDAYDRLTDRVLEWCRANPTLIAYSKPSAKKSQDETGRLDASP